MSLFVIAYKNTSYILKYQQVLAQSAGAVEYTDCISAEEEDTP